jgi:hypothetical protein
MYTEFKPDWFIKTNRSECRPSLGPHGRFPSGLGSKLAFSSLSKRSYTSPTHTDKPSAPQADLPLTRGLLFDVAPSAPIQYCDLPCQPLISYTQHRPWYLPQVTTTNEARLQSRNEPNADRPHPPSSSEQYISFLSPLTTLRRYTISPIDFAGVKIVEPRERLSRAMITPQPLVRLQRHGNVSWCINLVITLSSKPRLPLLRILPSPTLLRSCLRPGPSTENDEGG